MPEIGEGTRLLQVVKTGLGSQGTRVTRSAEGVRVPALLAGRLDELESEVELAWTPEARCFVENRRRVASVHPEVFAALQRIRREGVSLAESDDR